jgi:biopolymer transport protein ExbD
LLRPAAKPAEVVPNLAPMVDVIMVLLVFFLLGTSLEIVRHGVLETELDPSAGPGAGVAVEVKPRIRIGLTDVGDGAAAAIFVLDDPIGENNFAELLRYLKIRREAGADRENPVVIGAETEVRWQFVVSAMDAAVQAGFRNVQFAVSFKAGER